MWWRHGHRNAEAGGIGGTRRRIGRTGRLGTGSLREWRERPFGGTGGVGRIGIGGTGGVIGSGRFVRRINCTGRKLGRLPRGERIGGAAGQARRQADLGA